MGLESGAFSCQKQGFNLKNAPLVVKLPSRDLPAEQNPSFRLRATNRPTWPVCGAGGGNWVFVGRDMSKGLRTLDSSFNAESLTHLGGLFLIQRFCNKLCLRRRLERILKDPPPLVDYSPAGLTSSNIHGRLSQRKGLSPECLC
jgi:hypothetical protein